MCVCVHVYVCVCVCVCVCVAVIEEHQYLASSWAQRTDITPTPLFFSFKNTHTHTHTHTHTIGSSLNVEHAQNCQVYFINGNPNPILRTLYLNMFVHWEARCLALRTRNGGFENSFIPGGTLPTHLVAPKEWRCDMTGFLTIHISILGYSS